MTERIIAYCGIVCSECGAFKKSKCEGCYGPKPMFKNCPVKKCNQQHSYKACSDCSEYENLKDCGKLNNIISKIIGFIFKSDRIGNLNKIREMGFDNFKNIH